MPPIKDGRAADFILYMKTDKLPSNLTRSSTYGTMLYRWKYHQDFGVNKAQVTMIRYETDNATGLTIE